MPRAKLPLFSPPSLERQAVPAETTPEAAATLAGADTRLNALSRFSHIHARPESASRGRAFCDIMANKAVVVIGTGGVGAVAAEMLARSHIGRLHLIDRDRFEPANLNRLGAEIGDLHQSKALALAARLRQYLPAAPPDSYTSVLAGVPHEDKPQAFREAAINAYCWDVSVVETAAHLLTLLKTGSICGTRPVDLVICCVDNYQARLSVNMICNMIGATWIETGASEDAVGGHIQLIRPGRTPCFACAASVPTTPALVAGMAVQLAYKLFLQFGQISTYVSYNGLQDSMRAHQFRPNPECMDHHCQARQADATATGDDVFRAH
ncbi:hypothetical protein H696_02923 [Fonticula alba]|uniref:Ubiquitin-like modifier-activating enzyme 5 n=1 Tax=Fonticula alba TaxID=691883 RepID=A0A058Z9J4_FONAL|nr:hypothetical protein H696_02923 [Fonticula alba]KCV70578.1 hypothetical protein H696_02923 [Fonticula alba]|eukprot:XP_009495094.1 hypothetical protein H696_02923 [Fonticula alba]